MAHNPNALKAEDVRPGGHVRHGGLTWRIWSKGPTTATVWLVRYPDDGGKAVTKSVSLSECIPVGS